MANNGREYKHEWDSGQRPDRDSAEGGDSKHGDHPIFGDDKKPLGKEFLRSPERSSPDPMTIPPKTPSRSQKVVPIRGSAPHDPAIDYQPPNPMTVVPPANITMKIVGGLAALLLFALVLWFLFHNWMTPGSRQPGQQNQQQGLQQKIP